jgi:hypothetical protein
LIVPADFLYSLEGDGACFGRIYYRVRLEHTLKHGCLKRG